MMIIEDNFYKGKSVMVTGHTGFKGTWLCRMLIMAGAKVTGYALEPSEEQKFFYLSQVEQSIDSVYGDIRDFDKLYETYCKAKPEIVFHLAAQPLVRESYEKPRYTYDVNVMGTVNICECIRLGGFTKSFVNITTDKVYRNKEWEWGYRENEELNGYDPYSNSKSCSELVTGCFNRCFMDSVAVSTARAGNVIGGGDFSKDRIIPDCIRAAMNKTDIVVRNCNSIRPYQHVIEPLSAYIMIAKKQYENMECQGSYNVAPNEEDCITTGELVDIFCKTWGDDMSWINNRPKNDYHEACFLKLDCSLIKSKLNWNPRWNITIAIEKTVEWVKVYQQDGDIKAIMEKQIAEYCS